MLTRRIATVMAAGLLLWAFCEIMGLVNVPGQLVVVLTAPTVFGVVAYACVGNDKWRDGWLIAVAAIAPLFPILGMGSDPAKPGLQWLFYWPMSLALIGGAFLGWLLDTYLLKRAGKRDARA